MKPFTLLRLLAFLAIFILGRESLQAQQLQLIHNPAYWVYQNGNAGYDSGTFYLSGYAHENPVIGSPGAFSQIIYRIKGSDTLMRSLTFNDGAGLGIVAWNNRPFLYKRGMDAVGHTGMRLALLPLDSNFNFEADSIVIDSIQTLGWVNHATSSVVGNHWLFSYSTPAPLSGRPSPAMLVYDFQTMKFNHQTFPGSGVSIQTDEISYQASNPAIIPHDSGYFVSFDTLTQVFPWGKSRFFASQLLDLDKQLNIRIQRLLQFPFTSQGTGLRNGINTGLKRVRDLIPIGNSFYTIGLLNSAFNNSNKAEYTNDVGIIQYDRNWYIQDTLRIERPTGLSLNASTDNSACWCNGSLYLASNLHTDSNVNQSGGLSGLMITRVDTPLQKRWTRNVLIPSYNLNAQAVRCVNGKMVVNGSYWNFNTSSSGFFLLEVDSAGNYLPVSSQALEKKNIRPPYPNPVSQDLFLPEYEKPIQSFKLFDLNGRTVFEQQNPGHQVLLPALSNGFFLWEITLENEYRFRGKIIKQ